MGVKLKGVWNVGEIKFQALFFSNPKPPGAGDSIGAKRYDPATEQSLFINVNLWWGLVMLLFGCLMFIFAWRKSQKAHL